MLLVVGVVMMIVTLEVSGIAKFELGYHFNSI